MARKKTDHVILDGRTNNMRCTYCAVERPLSDINGKEVGEACKIMNDFVKDHEACAPVKLRMTQAEFALQYQGEFKADDEVFTGLYDINKRPICDGDIVFWDDNSNGEWSRIARVYWKKPVLVFKVVASPYLGVVGHEFNYGSFIWKETEKYLEIMPDAQSGMDKAAALRKVKHDK